MFKYFTKQNKNRSLSSRSTAGRGESSVFATNRNSGFAVLFAVLLASFLITLGISIFNISLKEILIATSARDSQVAYYIADSARECALYWDIKQGVFPACTDPKDLICANFLNVNGIVTPANSPYKVDITCNGNPYTLNFQKNGLTYTTFNELNNSSILPDFFKASSTLSSPVSNISITKEFKLASTTVITTIETWGHNTGIIGRRVERGIKMVHGINPGVLPAL